MTLITICECVQLITVYSDSDNNMGICSVGNSVVTLITIWKYVQLVTVTLITIWERVQLVTV